MEGASHADVIHLLKLRPTMDQVAEHVTLTALRGFRARSCAIAAIDAGACLRLVGSFGLSGPEHGRYSRLSVWDDDPLCGAIVEGTCRMAESGSEAAGRHAIAVPVMAPGRACGGISVTFDTSASLPAECTLQLQDIADLLFLVWPAEAPRTPGRATGDRRGTLTSRQSTILCLTADGLTNAAIARRIGFSESTVRQELMAIFRALGARTRQEAVLLAQEHGSAVGTPDEASCAASMPA